MCYACLAEFALYIDIYISGKVKLGAGVVAGYTSLARFLEKEKCQ